MRGRITEAIEALAGWRTARRRERNLRRGSRSRDGAGKGTDQRPGAPTAGQWIALAGLLAMLGGGALIAGHARLLSASAEPSAALLRGAGLPVSADAFQSVLPGVAFTIAEGASFSVSAHGDTALLIAAGMQASPAVQIDLCSQMADKASGRLAPLRIGYQFRDVARWVARNPDGALRNVALAGSGAAGMPQVQLTGSARADTDGMPLQLAWDSSDPAVRWLGEGGRIVQGASAQARFHADGWLVWKDAALRLARRASLGCPQAGQLTVQLYRAAPRGNGNGEGGRAMVAAFPASGAPLSAWLSPGRYLVPATPRASLEDQALFRALQARGLVRLDSAGLAELAPRDLASWQAAGGAARATRLDGWEAASLDKEALALLKRLYRMADGDYVRAQVAVFNAERRLLAWRTRPLVSAEWQASVGLAPAPSSAVMPAAAARLFAELPQGWAPWTRIGAWPQDAGGASAHLTLPLSHPARTGETLQLMLIGRYQAVQGATLRSRQSACTGRACPAPDAAQTLVFDLVPGARSVTVDAVPLAMAALAGDQQYRHLRVVAGRLDWQPLASNSAVARQAAPSQVTLADRNGTVLWSGGAPTPQAVDAGLATLLGLRADHANSVAGMLARLPAPGGQAAEPHQARLSIDLAMQTASQQALDCVGMRRGHWSAGHCEGGQAVPAGRQAGIVILDTANGDVLAAAGAGAGAVTAANWNEVRDFDRANPARSPLRLPALQHDGGAHRSPGSTFKVISALGLELAAQRDPQLEALLAGMTLPAMNKMAQSKGFAFQTNAASYPYDTKLAHITNYKDQHLDRRAQDGRLGLSQALTYSLNTWFAWSGELSDRSLFGRPEGGAPDLQALDGGALDGVRPIVAMAHRLGFEQPLRLDGALLPADYAWSAWDALQGSAAHIDPIHTRHELRQMAIGLRMQVTPLQMALVAGAIGQGKVVTPRMLLALDGREAQAPALSALGVRVDRVREGMRGVVDHGTAAGAFRATGLAAVRAGLSGKTGTSPSIVQGSDGARRELATVWFTGWLEPGSLPGQKRRLAVAAFVSHSEATGGEHAAPVVAAVLASLAGQSAEQKGK